MTIREWLSIAEKRLQSIAIDHDEARLEAQQLMQHSLRQPLSFLKSHPDSSINLAERIRLEWALFQRQRDKPLAYILGTQPFYRRDFIVSKHTLIPRQETEDLIDIVLSELKSSQIPLIIDIGTGSGAIACTLALALPKASVFATDVSEKALDIAKQNAKNLNTTISFRHESLLTKELGSVLSSHQGDRIVFCANLPYLPHSDKKDMQKSVTRYEPASALFADDAGMALTKKLILELDEYRKQDPRPLFAIFEIDPSQVKPLTEFVKENTSSFVLQNHLDRCGRIRFLSIKH